MSIFILAKTYNESIINPTVELVRANNESRDEEAFLELLAADLQPFYEPRLPYHNWDEHITSGLVAISKVCAQEAAKGKPINTFMARIAYMGHDAGYPQDLIEPEVWQPYGSKEGYSAHIMGTLLKGYGFEDDFIDGVKACIMFTKLGETLPEDISDEPRNTAMAVRTTDLYNVFGSYKGFITGSFKLMEEDKIYGRERKLEDFKNVTKFVLSTYIDKDFIPAGICRLQDGRRNIERFMSDTPKHLLKTLGEQATRFAQFLNKDAA